MIFPRPHTRTLGRSHAFTLIELLIVVAIIAILAAIAVPNFLEAQTRAKVARVKADQRTIATALEAYRIDTNLYPEQGVPNGTGTFPYASDPTRVYGGEGPNHAPNNPAIAYHLSTPVAYLASTQSVFRDPFFRSFDATNMTTSLVNDTRYYNYSGHYVLGRIYDAAQDGAVNTYLERVTRLANQNIWHLRSRGPDTDYERRSNGWEDYLTYRGAPGTGTGGNGGIGSLYDPTNGTASSGDLVRFGAGGAVN